jgi:hypothetical protein
VPPSPRIDPPPPLEEVLPPPSSQGAVIVVEVAPAPSPCEEASLQSPPSMQAAEAIEQGIVVVVDTGCMERRPPLFPIEASVKCSSNWH